MILNTTLNITSDFPLAAGNLLWKLSPIQSALCHMSLFHTERLPTMASVLDTSFLETYYDSYESLFDDLQTVCLAQGFAVRKLRSANHYRGQYTRIDICCVCQGQAGRKSTLNQHSQRASFRCDCQFLLRTVFRQHVQLWELMIVDSTHNHAPHDMPEEIAAQRRRARRASPRFELHLERLSLLGTKTNAEIASELQAILNNNGGPQAKVTARDVSNAQADLIRRKYGPLSSTQIFLEMLDSSPEIYHQVHRAQDGRIDAVFFTFEWAIGQWKRNHEVLSFDCTYRVNRFNMPLLQITGITTLHTTFTVSFCLVSGEKEADFLWPLERLHELCQTKDIAVPKVILSDMDKAFKNSASQVFPASQQQLCLWHVGKNVVHNIHRKWKTPNNSPDSPTEIQDDEQLAAQLEGTVDEFLVPVSAVTTTESTTPAGCIRA